jgi:DNA polymerase III alpha subunit
LINWKIELEDIKGGFMKEVIEEEKGTYIIKGVLKSLREVRSRKGDVMAWGTLQDSKGTFDLVFFPNAWNECKSLVNLGETVALKGSIDNCTPQKPCFLVSGIANKESKGVFYEKI